MDLAVAEAGPAKRLDVGLGHRSGRPRQLVRVRLERSDPLLVAGLLATERLTVLAQSVVRAVDPAHGDGDRLAFHARE